MRSAKRQGVKNMKKNKISGILLTALGIALLAALAAKWTYFTEPPMPLLVSVCLLFTSCAAIYSGIYRLKRSGGQ